jgi:hypothetical protein
MCKEVKKIFEPVLCRTDSYLKNTSLLSVPNTQTRQKGLTKRIIDDFFTTSISSMLFLDLSPNKISI